MNKLMWCLIAFQLVGSALLYVALRPISEVVAQGVMVCVLCPTATAAPVVTSMLGGSIEMVITYSLMSYSVAAVCFPLYLTFATGTDIGLWQSMVEICKSVSPLIFLPLLSALLFRKITPKAAHTIANHQGISFYIWAVALFIVVGRSVSFIVTEPSEMAGEIIAVALVCAVVCALQFWIGHKLGERMGDKIAGAQGLGQKNTVLALWISLTYLQPLASIGPASYILWHNIINSTQIYLHMKKSGKEVSKNKSSHN